MRTLKLRYLFVMLFTAGFAAPLGAAALDWTLADQQPPMTAAETRTFMKQLAQYVLDHHLKQNEQSPQRGMVYEYFDAKRAGQGDQFVQGEALDTMHDGAWLAVAMAAASQATGDPFYKEFLTVWQLPFYCRMLNHSDELFSSRENDARAEGQNIWKQNKEWLLQEGEKGFVPYWWDDGGSVSLETPSKDQRRFYPCHDNFVQRQRLNPQAVLSGYSLGSSNHLAQDLAVMLETTWLLLRQSEGPADVKMAAELAAAAKNLHQCRMNHHGHIAACCAATAVVNRDAGELAHVPDWRHPSTWIPGGIYRRALYDFKPEEQTNFPGFADDQEYVYYTALARHSGQLPAPLAFKLIYDAYTLPQLYRLYCDDAAVPAGINVFDLYPYKAVGGKPAAYRSTDPQPKPIGSRLGPQNMVVCGWGLQALTAYPRIWETPYEKEFSNDLRVYLVDRSAPSAVSEAVPWATLELGSLKLEIRSGRTELVVRGECSDDAAEFTLFSRPDGKGAFARVTLNRNEPVATAIVVKNDRNQPLVTTGDLIRPEKGFQFSLTIPYTCVKEQTAWANGVEHGRCSIGVGGKVRNLYLASREEDVRAGLEHELAGGLRTWEAIFREKGYVPTGIGIGAHWDRFSDTGGYAHLINAAAEWLLVLDGNRDWELRHVPQTGDQ